MFKPRKFIVGSFIGLIVIVGISGCGGTDTNNVSNTDIKTSPTTNEDKTQTVIVTSPLPTTPASPEQTKLYEYITEQKWAEAKKYMSDNGLLGVVDLEMLQSYVDIRIEFAILSNSKDEVKLYEPILGRINKLNIDEYTGDFKDQMSNFVEVFQKERKNHYDWALNNSNKLKKEKALSDTEAGIKKAITAIRNKDYERASSAVMRGITDESSAIYNYACALEEKVSGSEDMFIYYLEDIPTNYNGRLSDEILKLKLKYKTVDEWDQAVKDRAKILAEIEQGKIYEAIRKEAEAKKPNPYIGMSKEDLINSKWGKPTDINKTTTVYGTSEQWVYGNGNYIYLDDGIVTAIQN